MITSNTAKILGVDKITGTLEVGKDANIVISSGDLLDMMTSNVERAFITGREINLKSKQQILYDRFKKKVEVVVKPVHCIYTARTIHHDYTKTRKQQD